MHWLRCPSGRPERADIYVGAASRLRCARHGQCESLTEAPFRTHQAQVCCTFYAHPRLVPDAQSEGLLLGVTAVRLCGGQSPVVIKTRLR